MGSRTVRFETCMGVRPRKFRAKSAVFEPEVATRPLVRARSLRPGPSSNIRIGGRVHNQIGSAPLAGRGEASFSRAEVSGVTRGEGGGRPGALRRTRDLYTDRVTLKNAPSSNPVADSGRVIRGCSHLLMLTPHSCCAGWAATPAAKIDQSNTGSLPLWLDQNRVWGVFNLRDPLSGKRAKTLRGLREASLKKCYGGYFLRQLRIWVFDPEFRRSLRVNFLGQNPP